MAVRNVLVVGVTGSIGQQALEVIERSPDLRAVGLAALRDADGLLAAAAATGARHVALMDPGARAGLTVPDGVTSHGTAAELIDACAPDVVLNASFGSAGLNWTLETVSRRLDLALANKESLVAGGPVVARLLRESGSQVTPVDSEHSALHQLLDGRRGVRTLTITASGGPFRGRPWADLHEATLEQALRHPNWSMGNKNTIDSATLVNKGLELIEARYLFDWPEAEIRVDVQPQSILHAAVTLHDGTLIAAMSPPDMRRSIGYALHYPEIVDIGLEPTYVGGVDALAVEPMPADYPAVPLARASIGLEDRGGTAAFNAANEVAVTAFMAGALRFTGITEVIEQTLSALPSDLVTTLDEVLARDEWARATAADAVAKLAV